MLSETPEFSPPKTPAIHIASELLQIIKSSEESFRSTSSNVINLVLLESVFTITLLSFTFLASKA